MTSQESRYDLSLGLEEPEGTFAASGACGDVPGEAGPDGIPSAAGPAVPAQPEPLLPARERIADLLDKMRPCRGILLAIMRACEAPVPVSQINDLVASLQANNRSVFTAADLCGLLRRAGALDLVNADGSPFGREGGRGDDGEPRVAHWASTPDALGVAAEDDPLGRLNDLFDRDVLYLPVYKAVLELCAREGGAKTAALSAAVDADPLVQAPRYFATYFVDRLEKCDALEWKGAWHVTEVGLNALDALLEVEAIEVPEGVDLVEESPYATYDDFGPLEG